jgi:glycosyltransferase involved in cell wall biosynthesis
MVMKSVLFVCNYKPGVGGISGQVEILHNKLREEGYIAEIFSTNASVWKRLWMMPKLRRKAQDFDVLHIHCCSGYGGFFPAMMGIRIGKRLGKHIVLTYHGGGGESFFDRHPKLVHSYLMRTDANIVLSGFLARVFEKHQLPYTIIPNIIELDESLFRQRNTIRPVFICTRTHESLYNIPCILRAFQRVQKDVPESSLILVGDGPQHESLVQQADAMGLKNVVFTGRVQNKQIYDLLGQADVMLSSPTIDNMPVSLIEAMNAGLLVISSRVGGVPYMIEDGDNGLLFESNNDEELAEKMKWVLNHPGEVVGIIKRASLDVKKYSWNRVRDKLLAIYQ